MDIGEIERTIAYVAWEITKATRIDYDHASEFLCSFLNVEKVQGYEQLRIKGIGAEVISSVALLEKLSKMTFCDASEIVWEMYGVGKSASCDMMILVLLSGLFLLRKVRKLSTLQLDYEDSMLVCALIGDDREKLQLSYKEWRRRVNKLIVSLPPRLNFNAISLVDLNSRAKKLESLGAVKCRKNKWSIFGRVIFEKAMDENGTKFEDEHQ